MGMHWKLVYVELTTEQIEALEAFWRSVSTGSGKAWGFRIEIKQ
jgi:hypothetical protein